LSTERRAFFAAERACRKVLRRGDVPPIIAQIYRRYRRGQMQDERFYRFVAMQKFTLPESGTNFLIFTARGEKELLPRKTAS
jgi:hypothetical protein